MEVWKLINGSETDYVSNYGRVKHNDILRKIYKNKGFLVVKVKTKTTEGNRQVNKLVAEHFVDNPNNYRKLKHLDGNKENCRYDNLQWISEKEAYKSYRKSEKKKPIKVHVYTIEGDFVNTYSSIREASMKLNLPQPNIVAHIKGRNKRVGNYRFYTD